LGDGEKPIVGPVAVQLGEEAESRWLYVPRAFRLARISFDEREQRSSTLGLGDHLGPSALDRFVVQVRVAQTGRQSPASDRPCRLSVEGVLWPVARLVDCNSRFGSKPRCASVRDSPGDALMLCIRTGLRSGWKPPHLCGGRSASALREVFPPDDAL
jgi:hypothetical protein